MATHYEENADKQLENKSIKQEFEESTKVNDDDMLFMKSMLRMSRVHDEMSNVSQDFHDQEIEGYEALDKLRELLLIQQAILREIENHL